MANAKKSRFDLEELLSASQLPAMPQSALQILEISRNADAGPAELAVPVEADPGLTVQVLRFVNSSYFGFRDEISNVKQAIALVGMRTVRNFALYSAVFSLIPNPRCGQFDLMKLWQDSLRRALFARHMAGILGMSDVEEAFAAALLQDMAVPLLAKEVPDAYQRLFGARQQDSRVRLSLLEDHVFGWTHAQAAGLMARNWRLPEAFASLIEAHLDIDRLSTSADKSPGKLAVALSALLPATSEEGWPECPLFEREYQAVCPPQAPAIVELLNQIDAEFAEFAPILRINMPECSLAGTYQQTGVLVAG
ncbi:MAG: HDOD domain-containing protein [Thermoguttaceae bacterium]|jgi:HD-like signal output (HDOD) protein|nr:HDOD domain-containing protein [Thermoguttaceae bacterium]